MQRLPSFNKLWRSPFTSLRGRVRESPQPEAEDSTLLRVLVQALVIVAIVGTDIAAGVGEGQIPFSLWAVPLSVAGAIWSWYHRRDRNVPVKFLLAILMLGAMGYFFVNLSRALSEGRLVLLILAELLIQLQVLHSFDLPRRKDLGYSIVIGLILLGVAGTVSQTLAFAPVLLLFLAIALPVLVLDYRSRLGLSPYTTRGRRQSLNLGESLDLRRLSSFLLVIVVLGLTIFALMPRFPGYQLRTQFPVNAPINFTGKSVGSTIRNRPSKNNQDNTGKGGTAGESQGPGKMDETFYYGFASRINQNLRGELKPKVVMRVRSQAEGFWRVLAFDRYTGQGWEISRNDLVRKIRRPDWSYRFYISLPGTAASVKEVIQSYTVVTDLPNLIPTLSIPTELYFPSEEVGLDTEAGLRSPSDLIEGLTYTVISQVPYRDRSLLDKTSSNYPSSIREHYLQIPDAIADKVRQKTEEILANTNKVGKENKPITSAYEKAFYLAQYLKQNPIYKLEKEPPFLQNQEDLVEAFLFGYKNSSANQKITGGYGDHFSTVLTVMLRSIGIPARLVVGFAPGQFNPFTGLYVVKNTDAYAMTEVFFPKYGWFAFDPIPGHPLIPPSIEEDQTFSVVRQFWKWVAGWLPTPVSTWFGRMFEAIWSSLVAVIVWLWAILSNGWVGAFIGIVLAIGVGFLGWLAWNQWKRWRYQSWLAGLPPMESLYQQMLSTLATKGYAKHPAQTPLEYARVSYQHHSTTLAEAIDEISQAYVCWRYGFEAPNLKQLRQRLRELKKHKAVSR